MGRSMNFSRSATTPVSGAQPRLSIAAIASKYEVRGAPPRRSAAGSRVRPGKSAGTGAPIASRIVGRISTWRAARCEISPPVRLKPDTTDDVQLKPDTTDDVQLKPD